jgi:hypothetical protein
MRFRISIVLLTIFSAYCLKAQDKMSDVIGAAKAGYAEYLQKIPSGREKEFGFKNRAEFKNVQVGKPYQVMTMLPEFYHGNLVSGKDYVKSTSEYRFPLTINKNYRVMLTVAKMNGSWTVVNIGSAEMARELEQLEKKFPSSREQGKILLVTGINGEFYLSSNATKKEIAYPFASARLAMNWSNSESGKTVSEMLPALRTISDKNNQSKR